MLQVEKQDEVPEKDLRLEGIVLKLPHTIRNISTKMTLSNSFMISNNNTYAVAGVRSVTSHTTSFRSNSSSFKLLFTGGLQTHTQALKSFLSMLFSYLLSSRQFRYHVKKFLSRASFFTPSSSNLSYLIGQQNDVSLVSPIVDQ